MHKGHYGEYSGNAKWSKVTDSNMGATKRDDEAHMKYLKEDVDYDDKHGHSDSSMTSDEKHISKLAGDLKYDEKKHGSSNLMVSPLNRSVEKLKKVKSDMFENEDLEKMGVKRYNKKVGRLNKKIKRKENGSAAKMVSPLHNNEKKLARKQVKLEKTNEQIVEKYKLDRDLKDKSTRRKIKKYEKTEKQVKKLTNKN